MQFHVTWILFPGRLSKISHRLVMIESANLAIRQNTESAESLGNEKYKTSRMLRSFNVVWVTHFFYQ